MNLPCLYSLVIAFLLPGLLGLPLNSAPTNTEEHVRLYNLHTHGHLRIIGSNIDAEGNESDEYAQLILEILPVKNAPFRIRSEKDSTYLCVNSSGVELVVESTPSTRCEFVEGYHHLGYSEFQSVYNNNWYIGFKKNGQVKQPQKTSHGQKAARFLKR